MADDTWDRLVAASLGGPPPGAENPIEHITRPLTALRAAVAVVHYMNSDGTPPANQRLANVIHDINNEWIIIENAWNAANPNERVRVSEGTCGPCNRLSFQALPARDNPADRGGRCPCTLHYPPVPSPQV